MSVTVLRDLPMLLDELALRKQLNEQLGTSHKLHLEVLGNVEAERDAFKTELIVLREENKTLAHLTEKLSEARDRLA